MVRHDIDMLGDNILDENDLLEQGEEAATEGNENADAGQSPQTQDEPNGINLPESGSEEDTGSSSENNNTEQGSESGGGPAAGYEEPKPTGGQQGENTMNSAEDETQDSDTAEDEPAQQEQPAQRSHTTVTTTASGGMPSGIYIDSHTMGLFVSMYRGYIDQLMYSPYYWTVNPPAGCLPLNRYQKLFYEMVELLYGIKTRLKADMDRIEEAISEFKGTDRDIAEKM